MSKKKAAILVDNSQYAPATSNDNDTDEKAQTPISWRKLLRYATYFDYLLLTLGLLFSIALGVVAPTSLLVFREMFNTQIEAQTQYESANGLNFDWYRREIIRWALAYFTFGAARFCLAYGQAFCLIKLSERQVHQIRSHFLERVLRQSAIWFARRDVGTLMQRLSAGSDRIRDGMGDKIGLVLQAIVNCIVGLAVGISMSWRLAAIMTLAFPFIVVPLWAFFFVSATTARREKKALEAASGVADEALSFVRTVATFNKQEAEVRRYKTHLERSSRWSIKGGILTANFYALFMLVNFVSMAIVLWHGAAEIFEGRSIDVGIIFATFWCMFSGPLRFGKSISYLTVILQARIAAADLFDIIDSSPIDNKITSDAEAAKSAESDDGGQILELGENGGIQIDVRNLNFAYPMRDTVRVLVDVSFSARPGELVALVGKSGSGKSTLLNILMRFYEQKEGEIEMNGIDIRALNINWTRNAIGFVAQDSAIFGATVAENLRMGAPDASEAQMTAACEAANAHAFIQRLSHGYRTQIGDGGHQLSGGECQRLAIARMLLREPRVFLFDEATSALDSESERLVMDAINKARVGRTCIVVAHRLATVRNADRILCFESGAIVEAGTHAELMQREDGLYARLIAAQTLSFDDEQQQPTETTAAAAAVATDEDGLLGGGIMPEARMLQARRRSQLSTHSANDASESLDGNFETQTPEEASLLHIWRHAKSERTLLGIGVFACSLRGLPWPIYTLVLGAFFKTMSAAIGGGGASSIVISDVDGGNSTMTTTVEQLRAQVLAECSVLVGLGVYSALLCIVSGVLIAIGAQRFTQSLRVDAFRNLLRQDGEFFDQRDHVTSNLTSRLATCPSNIQAALDQRLGDVLSGCSVLVCGLCIAFYFSPKLAVIEIGLCSLFLCVQVALVRLQKRNASVNSTAIDEAYRLAFESLVNVQHVQALNREARMHTRFQRASAAALATAVRKAHLQGLLYALLTMSEQVHSGVFYILGLTMIASAQASPFLVYQVVEAINNGLIGVFSIAPHVPEYLRARVAAGLLFRLLEARSSASIDATPSASGKRPPIEGEIVFQDVEFAYPIAPNRRVLRGLNIRVARNQTLALVARSGGGKSTALALLARFYDANRGSITIDGYDLRSLNLHHFRRSIAFVSQTPRLFNTTIRENILYGLDSDIDDDNGDQAAAIESRIIEAARDANLHDFVVSLPLKYETIIGARGSQLSVGQRQRVTIARALFRNPRILILDEPSASLDAQSEKLVQTALERARAGRSCIVVAHRLSTIQNADLIAMLADGRVLELGSHQELVALDGAYARIVKAQSL